MQRKRSWRIPKLFRQCVYVPPIASSTSPNLPETVEDIQNELQKQESFLNKIHSELNAGAVTKKREDELWETQRIITQLKRQLRTFEKRKDSMQKSVDADAGEESIDFTLRQLENSHSGDTDDSASVADAAAAAELTREIGGREKICITENGLYVLPKDHPDYATLIKLQLENQELIDWKHELQARINSERAECVRLQNLLQHQPSPAVVDDSDMSQHAADSEYERLIEHYIKENSLLEQKRVLLAKEIFDENLQLVRLQVDLAMKQLVEN